MRQIVIDDTTVDSFQAQLTKLDNLYRAKLCIDRPKQWYETYDAVGNFIPESERKPYFEGSLPKRIIDIFTSELFGYDKFPRVTIKPQAHLYADTIALNKEEDIQRFITKDNVGLVDQNQDGQIDKEEVRLHLLANSKRLAEECLDAIIKQAFLQVTMLKAARKAFVMGTAMLLFKVSDGQFFSEVKDRRWLKEIEFDPSNPYRILSFREEYIYLAYDPVEKKPQRYIYRCDYNQKAEIAYKPVKFIGWQETYTFVPDPEKSFIHNLDFCPAALMRGDDDQGLLEDQMDNLLSYMYMGSDIYRGYKINMDPQWAVLVEDGNTDVKPRVKGNIWTFVGKSVQAITPDVGGYMGAAQFRAECRREILEGCRIQDVPYSNEQSAEAIRIRMKPQSDAVGEYRTLFGDMALVQFLTLMFRAAIKLKKNEEPLKVAKEYMIPDDEHAFQIELVWGQIETVTVDMMYQAVQMAVLAIQNSLLTEDAAIDMLVQFIPVQDVDRMKRELSKRRHEKQRDEKDLMIMDVVERVLMLIGEREQIHMSLQQQALAERAQIHNEEQAEIAAQASLDDVGETVPPKTKAGEE